MKNLSVFTGALLLSFGLNAAYAETKPIVNTTNGSLTKVAVVNVQQVLQQSPRVAELSKKLEAENILNKERILFHRLTCNRMVT